MAAPSVVMSLHAPEGIPLGDGHGTLITFAASSTVSFWEMTVTPPGADGGEPVATTSMHNDLWRTKRPRQLIELTDCSLNAQYDPNLYTDILTLINVETTIGVRFPDGSLMAFYGYLRSFTPQEIQEGSPPTANIVIVPTNWDPVNHVEAGPTILANPGS